MFSLARAIIAPSLLALLAACNIGTRIPEEDRTDWMLRGVDATIVMPDNQSVRGELLYLDESGILLLRDRRRVVLVEYPAIRYASFAQTTTRLSSSPTPRALAELRRFSRFPGGLDTGRLTRLLEIHGQTEPDVLR